LIEASQTLNGREASATTYRFELPDQVAEESVMVTHPLPVVVAPPKGPKPSKTDLRTPVEVDTFIGALLEAPCEYKHRNPLEWIVSFLVHVVLLAALLIVPLFFTQTLDLKAFQSTWLVSPAPPPPPPPAPAVERIAVRSVARLMQNGHITAPTAIPKKVTIIKEAPLPPEQEGVGVVGGVPGGIPGGQAGGVLGGIIGGTGGSSGPVIAPPAPTKRIVRIGGNLKPPRQIYSVAPEYPVIAKQAHVEGTVIIDAIIDEQGDIVQGRVLSGPALLIPSALQTVLKWKYEPSYLNGEPIAVEMHVEVHFILE
jgi:periplasmic protein TonB